MSYLEEYTESFYKFSEKEEKIIDSFLESKGYGWGRATVCGDCCGIYASEYWVDGIGGNFKEDDKKALYKLLKAKEIKCSIGGYTISADPKDEEEYQIK